MYLADPDSIFVTEVSSFQLEDIWTFRPSVATWLNFSPDHLDRYDRLEDYRSAKERIFENQSSTDVAVLGEDPSLDDVEVPGKCLRVRHVDEGEEGVFLRAGSICLRHENDVVDLAPARELALPGPHNVSNAMAAAATAFAAGAKPEAIRESLAQFPGLAHRLETVGSVAGVRCVNDSKATNVDSLAVALDAFADPILLIAGGVGKGQDFSGLAGAVTERTAAVFLIGEAAGELEDAWAAASPVQCESLESAIEAAFTEAGRLRDCGQPVGPILLSPGCASFDMFRDYEARGEAFREIVARWSRQKGV